MKKMLVAFILSLVLITSFQKTIISSSKPEIKSIYTDYPKDGVWVHIPKGTEKITFHVEAENTETILFWLIPTGTQTWIERRLIGYDIREDQTDNNFSLTWNIDKPYLYDHLYIQAIGEEMVTQNEINLYME